MHISLNSPVPDNCIQYSLSDSRHPHNQINDQCDDLKTILDEVKFDVEQRPFSSDDEEDNAVYTVMEACYHIAAWRAHQLRTINQERAKQDVLDTLNDQTVLITQDWAMKFLPQHYCESQGNWFAKRGISWHLTYVATK